MATTGYANHNSYLLAVKPVEYSLTEGTNIPPPPETPKKSPTKLQSSVGGPLTSHPATSYNIPGAYPSSDDENENVTKTPEDPSQRERADSFRTPESPNISSSPPMERRPTGIRRIMSLSNLRSSFSSSRTSLSQPRASTNDRSTIGSNRPTSPSFTTSTAPSLAPRASLRKRKSGNWFKRKSSMFLTNHHGTLDTVAEDGPYKRESKRFKESAPSLPELGFLEGGSLTGGDMGWDEHSFTRQT